MILFYVYSGDNIMQQVCYEQQKTTFLTFQHFLVKA